MFVAEHHVRQTGTKLATLFVFARDITADLCCLCSGIVCASFEATGVWDCVATTPATNLLIQRGQYTPHSTSAYSSECSKCPQYASVSHQTPRYICLEAPQYMPLSATKIGCWAHHGVACCESLVDKTDGWLPLLLNSWNECRRHGVRSC